MIASHPASLAEGTARVDLMSVDRSTNNSVLVRFRMVNEGQEELSVLGSLSEPVTQPRYEADGVTLIDAVNLKRHFPLATTNDACLCSSMDGVSIPPGKVIDVFALLPAPPADLQRITVSVPLTPAFVDVPIGAGPVQQPGVDPASSPLKPPRILSLISTSESDEEAIDEDDRNQKVRLSSDVLFALNRADLSPRAQAILQRVAQRVNASPGKEVTVDGHTDTSGNDAINQPLSERRAQSVVNQLRRLVTRPGVTYKAAGHGSKEPVADNGTEQGRRRNRRVTVTFARPVPPRPTPPPTSAPPPPPATGGKLPVLATAQPQGAEVQNTRVELNMLRREATGLVSFAWTLTNTGSEDLGAGAKFVFSPQFGDDFFNGGTTPGVNLLDQASHVRYRPLRDSENRCVCSDFTIAGRTIVGAGDSVTFYGVYKLPPEVRSVTVEIPSYRPVDNVAIS